MTTRKPLAELLEEQQNALAKWDTRSWTPHDAEILLRLRALDKLHQPGKLGFCAGCFLHFPCATHRILNGEPPEVERFTTP